ncbi:MAG: 16S rRNA (guanine(966)-N(2))-methyltransferase RsmD [Rubricoccaceae bacterium]
MRIVGGAFRSARLLAPPGQGTRPTTDRVREALFNVLGARLALQGARVLDLFAGSGALALEAISRGAASAVLVEADRRALAVARRNAEALGVAARCTFVGADVRAFLRRAGAVGEAAAFGLVLADPPYDWPDLAELPARVRPLLETGGLFALEHDARHAFHVTDGLVFTRAYGRTVLSLFSHSPDQPPVSQGDASPASVA